MRRALHGLPSSRKVNPPNLLISNLTNLSLTRFAVRDMRQTVAVGVIKATTPKVLEGKQTKAAEKAMKKK